MPSDTTTPNPPAPQLLTPSPHQTKRPKPDPTPASTTPAAAVWANPAPAVASAPPPPVIDHEAQQAALLAAKEKERLAIFTTGSDSEDDVPLATKAQANGKKRVAKQDSSSDDDQPLAKKVVAARKKVEKKVVEKEDDGSSEDEKPLATRVKAKAAPKAKPAPKGKNAKASTSKREDSSELSEQSDEGEDDEEDYDDLDVPLAKAKAKPKPKAATKPKAAPKKAPAKPKKEESATPKKEVKGKGKAKGKKEDGEDEDAKSEDEVFRWWDVEDDGITKVRFSSFGLGGGRADDFWFHAQWKTLEHNGILFPPDYEPHGVKMKYDGAFLSPLAHRSGQRTDFLERRQAGRPFSRSRGSRLVLCRHPRDRLPQEPRLCQELLRLAPRRPQGSPYGAFLPRPSRALPLTPPQPDGNKIKSFDKCDFTPIFACLEAEKVKKKEMTNAQKKVVKAARDILEAPYKTCLLDGRKEKVGNFRVEPPGLFRGRGEHPKTGLLKVRRFGLGSSRAGEHELMSGTQTRVKPEQITINIGKSVKVPEPPAGHRWKDVVHDDKVTWLATWKENINGAVK